MSEPSSMFPNPMHNQQTTSHVPEPNMTKGMEKWRQAFNKHFSEPMSKNQFKEFMQGVEKMICQQIKKDEARMKKAMQKMKEREKQ